MFLLAAVLAGGFREAAASATAQSLPVTVSGTVRDTDGRPLAGASVSLGATSALSGADGVWQLTVAPGRHVLEVSLDGFDPVRKELDVVGAVGPVEVVLTRPIRLREDLVVRAVRAEDRDPITKSDLDRREIAAVNRGQEMPFLIGSTPAVTFQSDGGAAAGYAYFTIRGIGQTRLNVTLDGIPLQDPEDQALYFSNLGDLASVVDSMQIQRGVGTSSVGSASYGGSVNFASVNPAEKPGMEVQLGGGSWGTARGTVAVHSGRLPAGFALYGRLSAQTSDGFREHAFVHQQSVYYGATRQDARSSFKLFGASGRTRTGLSYLATEETALESDLQANPLASEERDSFGQDVVHAQYTRLLGGTATVMAQAYYNGAQGWFRIWDAERINLQQYGLDGHFVGVVLGATGERGRLRLNWGAHFNDFTRDHFMDIVGGTRSYVNTGRKNESSTFLKATWSAGTTQFWGDVQARHARFRYEGDVDLGAVAWTFVNPKAGVRVGAGSGLAFYGSIGRTSREPARSDMLAGEDNATLPYDLQAVKPERVLDLEAGIEVSRGTATIRASLYAMEFRDEIALTGELSAIGLPVRRNVERSYRRGIEIDATWTPIEWVRLAGNASISSNQIAEWRQFYDVYDGAGSWIGSVPVIFRDVPPLLTPAVIVNGAVDWRAGDRLDLGLAARWADRGHLDNTGNRAFRTPSFALVDARATISPWGLSGRGHPRLRVQVDNLFNATTAWPGGYSYLYYNRDASGRDTAAGSRYFYPLATRSVYVTLEIRF